MSKISIDWLHDDIDCETCGGNYAEGARVSIDDVVVLDLEPIASCFGGENYDSFEVFKRLLIHLGHEIEMS